MPSFTNASTLNKNRKPTDQDLYSFCLAVREKKDWERKIWDENLALKWSIEAELTPLGSAVLQGEALAAVQELRRETTIHELDHAIMLVHGPDSSITEKYRGSVTGIDDPEFINALKFARGSKYAIREPDLKERGMGVFVSDDLVPESVHRELVQELNALAVKEPRDFHPSSFGKVQDLIHPSLYPYIAGTTHVYPDVKLPPIEDDSFFCTDISNNLDIEDMVSSFAWIPSVFAVSLDGTDVHIDSYINGLGTREEYPSLFRVIEKMFLLALPHFEKTINESEKYNPQISPSVERWMDRQKFASMHEFSLTREMWKGFLDEHESKWETQKRERKEARERLREEIRDESMNKNFLKLSNEFVASDMYKGQQLKVIVKAANYTLTPGREYEGSWHMEGMPHERIIASTIYYYETDDAIEDRGLSFRKFRDSTKDFPDIENFGYRHEHFRLAFVKENGPNSSKDRILNHDVEDEEFEYEDNYPSDWETKIDHQSNTQPIFTSEIPSFIKQGTVLTTNFNSELLVRQKGTGRMLSFPNWLQHKVESIKNQTGTGNAVATRKILCFFLVDDTIQDQFEITRPGFTVGGLEEMNVLTTSEVPMQTQKTNEPTMRALITMVSERLTGQILPPELVQIICEYVFEGTFTREEAEKYRLKLMNDRKVRMKRDFGHDRTYSLCEH
ncbi:hypothetical protein J3R30DRAFT_3739498 [Lentinula aciculospora]|uniref:DUF4246 domain-containing protein n=1 Tax=Lentinula aciculospora TaxID=153920 RepID=A0A9W9DG68_9AGAR|nr:hypothetical protein J3R30DRAFT_3739498 [Lentinula aciculospora]